MLSSLVVVAVVVENQGKPLTSFCTFDTFSNLKQSYGDMESIPIWKKL